MYENKISTATLGGHGTGVKLALATGCFHADRVTGFYIKLFCKLYFINVIF